ncbi:hypothetical protein [Nocardia sp. NPDC050175]|uniref:hypothetical protein n=1 Tax=Nocardia sp. NPDC050175 TaxID=3364317 RepID=UPI0037B3F840
MSGSDYIAKYEGYQRKFQSGRTFWYFDERPTAGRWAPGACLTPDGSVSGKFLKKQCGFDICWQELSAEEARYGSTVSKKFYQAAGAEWYFDGDDITWA